MIQVVSLRTWVPKGESKPKGYFKPIGLNYKSLKELFDNVEQGLASTIAPDEHYNLFYTVAHHLEGKRIKSSWQAQDIIPFDLDGIDLSKIEEYPQIVADVCGFDISKTAIIHSGNGCHVLVQVPLIKDPDYIKDAKLGYVQLIDRIVKACEDKGLPIEKDTTAWDYARILRCPFTKNVKEGKEDKYATVFQNNLEEQDWKIPHIERTKKDLVLAKGSFPTPDHKEILKGCDFFKWLKDSPDEVHEPHAYAMLSIAGYFPDDHVSARDLYSSFSSPSINSKPFPDFLEQALKASGPRTCEGINEIYGKCSECPNFKKVKSPILLKSEDWIGTMDKGFSIPLFAANGNSKGYRRVYEDLLKHFNNIYKHKSVGAINKIYLWKDTHYEITDDTFIKHFAHSKFIPLPKADERREFLTWVKDTNYTNQTFLDNEKSKGKVNLQNGVLDLDTKELVPHNHDYEFLYCLPFEYDPEATCPRWDTFIEDVTLGRECLKNVLHEYLGYIISGSNYKFQKALILDGAGNNGKTTFLKVMKKLVGATNISNLSLDSIQSQTFSSAGLHGKLCNISEEEPPKTFREQNGVFKNITGDGVVNAQHKYGNPFEFENKAKIVITYNEMPYINDTTDGMMRRLLITPWQFDVSKHPEKKDPDIEYKLYNELPGIFNRCLEGWYRLDDQKGFTRSMHVDRKVKDIKLNSDVVARFLEECTEQGVDEEIAVEALYNAYVTFHASEGENSKTITKNSFQRRMRKYNISIERKKVGGRVMYMAYGVELTSCLPTM